MLMMVTLILLVILTITVVLHIDVDDIKNNRSCQQYCQDTYIFRKVHNWGRRANKNRHVVDIYNYSTEYEAHSAGLFSKRIENASNNCLLEYI